MTYLAKTFVDIYLAELRETVTKMKNDGYRFVQLLASRTEEGFDLVYTFNLDGLIENYRITGLNKTIEIPSITDSYLNAFVFENEAHDLYGANIVGIAIDYQGSFYNLKTSEPMTIISPEHKQAMERAKKIAAAKAAKSNKGDINKNNANVEKNALDSKSADDDVVNDKNVELTSTNDSNNNASLTDEEDDKNE